LNFRVDEVAPAAHPSADLLSAYASGWIASPAQLCVNIHLEGCSACRKTVAALEQTEAEFVDALPGAPMEAGALSALLEALERTSPEPPLRPKRIGDVPLPKALWGMRPSPRRWIAPGFWAAHFPQAAADTWRAYVLRAPAGGRIPDHGHAGPELICVLRGGLSERGRSFHAGDFLEVAGGEHHDVVALDEICACFIACRGPLHFKGVARILKSTLGL
jgi:putative transcriptional regulator